MWVSTQTTMPAPSEVVGIPGYGGFSSFAEKSLSVDGAWLFRVVLTTASLTSRTITFNGEKLTTKNPCHFGFLLLFLAFISVSNTVYASHDERLTSSTSDPLRP